MLRGDNTYTQAAWTAPYDRRKNRQVYSTFFPFEALNGLLTALTVGGTKTKTSKTHTNTCGEDLPDANSIICTELRARMGFLFFPLGFLLIFCFSL